MKIKAIPFCLGAWIGGYLIQDYTFAVGSTITMIILFLTDQIEPL